VCRFNQPWPACKPLNISANHLAGVVYDVNRFFVVCFPKPDFSLSVLRRVNPTVFPGGCDTSKFSGFKSYGHPNESSEAEVTSSILKGHDSMMAALTNRGRQVEIIQRLWQNKDAKTGTYYNINQTLEGSF
jgi:hypothetical protein